MSHSIVNNNIFWKRVTRPFRCIYDVNCFKILRFFCWDQHKFEKMHFFQQLKDHNSGREHENYINDPFFHLLFLLYLLVTFISEFENTLNSFSNSLLRSILVCKIPQFLQKLLIWTAHQTSSESIDTLRLPKIYIMFYLPAGAKYPFFRIQLLNYLGVWRKFHTELFSFFITFLVTKNSF